ncbi:hypothetical protein [Nocardioides sp.]|uniref:hypothetical protein n=1 Tax=Nocardioides sp. TaxID=35761 RepID=UPI001988435F|nr:hypothetical protein [Nocardioides sp.]MBC7277458.1 hypothetical protein [Nocardioides sp.]
MNYPHAPRQGPHHEHPRDPLAVAGRLAAVICSTVLWLIAAIAIIGAVVGIFRAFGGDLSWRMVGIWTVVGIGCFAFSWIVAALGRIGLDDGPIGSWRVAPFELARILYRNR